MLGKAAAAAKETLKLAMASPEPCTVKASLIDKGICKTTDRTTAVNSFIGSVKPVAGTASLALETLINWRQAELRHLFPA